MLFSPWIGGDDTMEMMLFAFLTGVTIVISRTVNAKLSEHTSPHTSTLMNYIVGLLVSLLLMFLMKENLPSYSALSKQSPYIYLGGALGVIGIFVANIITYRISSYKLTLLLFISQLFAGIIIDNFIYNIFSTGKLIGGLCIFIGIIINRNPEPKVETHKE